jgi:predicted nucleic acid-binding protein
MIVLDASVLIGHLDSRDRHHARARDLLVANAGSSFGASSISLAETLLAPARSGKLETARDALARLAITELARSAQALGLGPV